MERKYDMRICKCGKIHMIPEKKIDDALENNKNLLFICASCGEALLIGGDVEIDWDDPSKDCYMMYSGCWSGYEDTSLTKRDFETAENHKGINEIFYSHGIRVPMMTGQNATDYMSGVGFSDRWYPDFWKIQRVGITVPEIMKFIEEYKRDRTTVNMSAFINSVPEDMLEEISHYHIEGLNWKGTKWETEWNSK